MTVSDATPPTDSLSDTHALRVSVNSDEQNYDEYNDEEENEEQAEQLFWKRTTMYHIENGKGLRSIKQ